MSAPEGPSLTRVAHVITGDLKSQIDCVWDAFWSVCISNPLEVIEQITYLVFIRRLDRGAAVDAFADFLDEVEFYVNQIRFNNLLVDELTKNGIVEPSRLFESPTGPDYFFPDARVEVLVDTLHRIKQTALPEDVA